MVGLFYATGLGGIKEDQGKVRDHDGDLVDF